MQSLEGKDGGRYRTLKSSLPTILIYLAESFLVDRKIFMCRIRPSAVVSAEILTEKFLSGSWRTVRRDFWWLCQLPVEHGFTEREKSQDAATSSNSASTLLLSDRSENVFPCSPWKSPWTPRVHRQYQWTSICHVCSLSPTDFWKWTVLLNNTAFKMFQVAGASSDWLCWFLLSELLFRLVHTLKLKSISSLLKQQEWDVWLCSLSLEYFMSAVSHLCIYFTFPDKTLNHPEGGLCSFSSFFSSTIPES